MSKRILLIEATPEMRHVIGIVTQSKRGSGMPSRYIIWDRDNLRAQNWQTK